MDILEIKNVTYNYSNSREKILLSVNQKFELGQFYAIIGKSGAGKSTLLSLLAGLDKPQKGQILFKNEDIENKGYSNHRKNNITLVFQNYNLIDYLTPIENVRLVNKKASEDILLQLGLDKSQINRNVMKLSGGQQQRVMLARALVGKPELLILDEPTTGMDSVSIQSLCEVLQKRNEKGLTILMVSHGSLKPYTGANRLWNAQEGRIIEE